MITNRNKRGISLLYVIGISVIAAGLSAVAVRRSLECYRISAMQEYRLQVQNALEGALVLLNGTPDEKHQAEVIGQTEVVFGEAYLDNSRLIVPFTIMVMKNGSPVYDINKSASYTLDSATWKFNGFTKGGRS
jgi:hypothetical protein